MFASLEPNSLQKLTTSIMLAGGLLTTGVQAQTRDTGDKAEAIVSLSDHMAHNFFIDLHSEIIYTKGLIARESDPRRKNLLSNHLLTLERFSRVSQEYFLYEQDPLSDLVQSLSKGEGYDGIKPLILRTTFEEIKKNLGTTRSAAQIPWGSWNGSNTQ